jgi:transcriptional regulator with XRE-family HTH domain
MELRQARLKSNMTQNDVARELGWSLSKLIRIETGRVKTSRTDLKALLSHYGLTDEEFVEELVRLADEAKTLRPKHLDAQLLKPEFVKYLGSETAASSIETFQPIFMPGLLQTREYASRLIRAMAKPGTDEEVIERQTDIRMRRAAKLDEDARFHFILDEAVVRRCVGGGPGDEPVMRRQLEWIAELGTRPHITIQIVLFRSGFHPGMNDPFIILGFPDDPPQVYLESAKGSMLTKDDQDMLSRYRAAFEGLAGVATDPGDLRTTISRLLDTLG